MKIFFVLLFTLLLVATSNSVFANDIFVSETEQSSRDSGKMNILLRERASERELIEQKELELAVAEATGNASSTDALKDGIAQHKINLELLENELLALQAPGGNNRRKTMKGQGTADQPNKMPEWWDPYSRKTEISMHY